MQEQLKPYSVTMGKPITNWWKTLERLRELTTKHVTGMMTSEEELEKVRMNILASNWVTCACGNQCSIIPRDNVGGPKDRELNQLGVDFYTAVMGYDVGGAKKILHKIEERSASIIKKINAQSRE